MAKLKATNIGQTDLIEYLNTSSDFAFELRCLEFLSKSGFECQHGGSYTDPVTKKTRQYDIRAQKSNRNLFLKCAIECKNLNSSFPLLVMCIPRTEDESFHQLIFSFDPTTIKQPDFIAAVNEKICHTINVHHPYSAYECWQPVGKNCAQVGVDTNDSIVANDKDVFEKWSQALASAGDIAEEAAQEGKKRKNSCLSLILPIMVVPDGMLWKVDFKIDGARNGDPVQVDRCSFFVDSFCSAGFFQDSLILSHLEFVTMRGLEALTKDILVPNNSWFPVDAFEDFIER